MNIILLYDFMYLKFLIQNIKRNCNVLKVFKVFFSPKT